LFPDRSIGHACQVLACGNSLPSLFYIEESFIAGCTTVRLHLAGEQVNASHKR
jgi:hypothetical protein